MCIYTHIRYTLDIVYELPLLPNKTATEILLYKTGAVRSVDWIFIIGEPAWRWVGKYMTLDIKFNYILFKQEVPVTTVTSKFSSL